MSGPDLIDERFDDLVHELRSGEATASPELRERVRGIAQGTTTSSPPAARFGRFRRRRVALVLVPVAAALAAAVGVGVFGSGTALEAGGERRGRAALEQQKHALTPRDPRTVSQPRPFVPARPLASHDAAEPPPLPPSGSRAQLYAVALELRVNSLSSTTKRAIQLTRSWGGYVVTVDYGSGQKSGTAYLVLRVPIVKVQTAVAKLSALGTIADEHVSIQDVQGQLNTRFSQMQDLKATIAGLRARLTDTSLTDEHPRRSSRRRSPAAVAQLAELQDRQTAQKARASFATLSLDLETKKAAAVVPSRPGKIGAGPAQHRPCARRRGGDPALHPADRRPVHRARRADHRRSPHAPPAVGGPAARPLREDRPRGRATIRRGLARAARHGEQVEDHRSDRRRFARGGAGHPLAGRRSRVAEGHGRVLELHRRERRQPGRRPRRDDGRRLGRRLREDQLHGDDRKSPGVDRRRRGAGVLRHGQEREHRLGRLRLRGRLDPGPAAVHALGRQSVRDPAVQHASPPPTRTARRRSASTRPISAARRRSTSSSRRPATRATPCPTARPTARPCGPTRPARDRGRRLHRLRPDRRLRQDHRRRRRRPQAP